MAQSDVSPVERRVIDAARSAAAHPEARVLLDMFVDKDRGYWCRHGLVDGADQPRPAYLALKSLAQSPA